MVATNSGQPGLMLGDEIVAVDGETLEGRPIGQVITRKDAYVFTVRRDQRAAAGALERVLQQMSRDAPVSGKALCTFDDLHDGLGDKALSLVAALEEAVAADASAARAGASADGLAGFWRLRLTSDAQVATDGFTGFGAAPYCLLHASFLLLQADKQPGAQLVEVVGQQRVGQHAIAALKGEWDVHEGADAGGGGAPTLDEAYTRLEFAGAAQVDAPRVAVRSTMTYLGEGLRIVRRVAAAREQGDEDATRDASERVPDARGEIYVYERQTAQEAQGEIARLLDVPVPRPPPTSLDDLGDVPPWARRGGGGGGPAPEPMPDLMGP